MKKNYQKPAIKGTYKIVRRRLLSGSCTAYDVPICTNELSCPDDIA